MAPAVVLLHAFPLDKRLWDDVVGPVAEAGWDVVVPDLLGFGESRLPEDYDDEPTLARHARSVLGILDRVGVANAVFCGISLGGYVAMEIVRQDPSRVAGIALVDTKATADADEARANRLRVAEQVTEAGSTEETRRPLDLAFPREIFSLSHVALPFPMGDSLYGLKPDPADEDFGVHLGDIAPRGERGVLIVPLDSLVRVSSNPFFPYLLGRIDGKIPGR